MSLCPPFSLVYHTLIHWQFDHFSPLLIVFSKLGALALSVIALAELELVEGLSVGVGPNPLTPFRLDVFAISANEGKKKGDLLSQKAKTLTVLRSC